MATLHRSLLRHGFSVLALHGDMDQPARTAALEQFRKGEVTLLVASDVAARGLDIPDVSHIYNFDVPLHPDDYVHRIGRTGRAGRTGTAITIVAGSNDAKAVAAIEKLIGSTIPSWTIERSRRLWRHLHSATANRRAATPSSAAAAAATPGRSPPRAPGHRVRFGRACAATTGATGQAAHRGCRHLPPARLFAPPGAVESLSAAITSTARLAAGFRHAYCVYPSFTAFF